MQYTYFTFQSLEYSTVYTILNNDLGIYNGEYSGQNRLLPEPQFWRGLIFAPFFTVFRDVLRSEIYQSCLIEGRFRPEY